MSGGVTGKAGNRLPMSIVVMEKGWANNIYRCTALQDHRIDISNLAIWDRLPDCLVQEEVSLVAISSFEALTLKFQKMLNVLRCKRWRCKMGPTVETADHIAPTERRSNSPFMDG